MSHDLLVPTDAAVRNSRALLTRMLAGDVSGWLPDNLLERGDRMSMAASVELRPPFLDVDVVDLAFSLPSRMKVRSGTGKWAIRQVARSLLPAEVVDRPKVGFRVPLDDWFRTGLRDMARERLTDGVLTVTASMFFRSELSSKSLR